MNNKLISPTQLETYLINDGIQETTQHSEFKSGLHGQKLHADEEYIPVGSEREQQCFDLMARLIIKNERPLPELIIGIADGGNRFASGIAGAINQGVWDMHTVKNEYEVTLTNQIKGFIKAVEPKKVVVADDIGSTGLSILPVALELRELGVESVVSYVLWQRRESLEYLDENDFVYRALIKHVLPDFKPQDCRTNPKGFCKQGLPLVAHKK